MESGSRGTEAAQGLKTTLEYLQSLNHKHLTGVQSRLREHTSLLEQLHDEQQTHAQIHSVALQRVAELDTKAPEQLCSSLQTQSHRYSLLHQTPDFKFRMTVDYPIRYVEADIPSTSVWQDYPLDLGSGEELTFVATLKNKRTISSTATVRLLGWRKEVHADELRKQRELEVSSRARLSEISREISTTKDNLEHLRGQLEMVSASTAQFARDAEQVASISGPTDAEDTNLTSDALSMFELASHLELTSHVKNIKAFSLSIDEIADFFNSQAEQSSQLSSWIQSKKDELERITVSAEHAQLAHETRMKTMFTPLSHHNPQMDDLHKVSTDPNLLPYARPLHRILAMRHSLSSDSQYYHDLELQQHCRVPSSYTKALTTAIAELESLEMDVRHEMQASREIAAWLQSDALPIGAFAMVFGLEKRDACWTELWRVVLARIKSCSSGGVPESRGHARRHDSGISVVSKYDAGLLDKFPALHATPSI